MASQSGAGISDIVNHGQRPTGHDSGSADSMLQLLLEDLSHIHARTNSDVRLDMAPFRVRHLAHTHHHALDRVHQPTTPDAPVQLGRAHGSVQGEGAVEGRENGCDTDTTSDAEDVGVLGCGSKVTVVALEVCLALVAVGALDKNRDAGLDTALLCQQLGKARVRSHKEGDTMLTVSGGNGTGPLDNASLLGSGVSDGRGRRQGGTLAVRVGGGVRVVPRMARVAADDGEGMVLPHAPGDGREVGVAVAVAVNARDVDADVLVVNAGDVRPLDSVLANTDDAEETIKTPD